MTEGITTEFKREYTDDIKKTIITFANARGSDVLIGVEDDGTVIGVTNVDGTMLKVTNAMRDSIKPDITMFLLCEKKAPEFTLLDKDGSSVSLSDFAGKKVVLYFYPKDNTTGCTRQACAFAGAHEEFKKLNVVVIGVSKDSVASHQKFAEKHGLPFILLSDPELTAIQAYGVWQEKKLYDKVSMGVVRSTFIIDEKGMIEQVMPKVKPDTNAADILAYLKES